jgi:hypothetical protein
MNHNQPNDRPINPRCAKLLSGDFACTCDLEWKGWDGTADGLDRQIVLQKRLDLRSGWGITTGIGPGPDKDEKIELGDVVPASPRLPLAEHGLWKESENLKTLRGDASWEDNVNRTILMDKLRLHIIERGYWGDCSGAELDDLRQRVAIDQAVRPVS